MACTPRDMVIEQVQTSPPVSFTPNMNPKNTFEIYLNHAIKHYISLLEIKQFHLYGLITQLRAVKFKVT